MKAPTTRGAAIAANCRDCVHDPAALGTWKEQISACSRTACPFWRFRPLSGNAPVWLKSRNAADLPEGWSSLNHDEAIRRLRGITDEKAHGCAVQANGGACGAAPMQHQRPITGRSKTRRFERAATLAESFSDPTTNS